MCFCTHLLFFFFSSVRTESIIILYGILFYWRCDVSKFPLWRMSTHYATGAFFVVVQLLVQVNRFNLVLINYISKMLPLRRSSSSFLSKFSTEFYAFHVLRLTLRIYNNYVSCVWELMRVRRSQCEFSLDLDTQFINMLIACHTIYCTFV